jgi:hypothetical protein
MVKTLRSKSSNLDVLQVSGSDWDVNGTYNIQNKADNKDISVWVHTESTSVLTLIKGHYVLRSSV